MSAALTIFSGIAFFAFLNNEGRVRWACLALCVLLVALAVFVFTIEAGVPVLDGTESTTW